MPIPGGPESSAARCHPFASPPSDSTRAFRAHSVTQLDRRLQWSWLPARWPNESGRYFSAHSGGAPSWSFAFAFGFGGAETAADAPPDEPAPAAKAAGGAASVPSVVST